MMEHGAHPRLIVEVLLDNASSLPGRQRHNISAFLDADRDFASSASSATSEIAGSKVGTIAFESKFHTKYRDMNWTHLVGCR